MHSNQPYDCSVQLQLLFQGKKLPEPFHCNTEMKTLWHRVSSRFNVVHRWTCGCLLSLPQILNSLRCSYGVSTVGYIYILRTLECMCLLSTLAYCAHIGRYFVACVLNFQPCYSNTPKRGKKCEREGERERERDFVPISVIP